MNGTSCTKVSDNMGGLRSSVESEQHLTGQVPTGRPGLRLAYISDQRFLVDEGGTWYSSAPLPLDAIADRTPSVSTWTFVGRLGHYAGEAISPIPDSRFAPVLYDGVWGQPSGLGGYARRFWKYVGIISRVVRSHDIIVLKFGGVSSLLALMLVGRCPVVVGYMIADLMAGSHAYRGWLNRQAMLLSVCLYRRRSSRLDLQVFVSGALARLYGNPCGGGIVVANENLVPRASIQGESATKRSRGDLLRVVYVGRLSPEKGLETLVEAFETGVRSRAILTLIGEGQLRPDLDNIATRSESLGRTIRLVGRLTWGDPLFAELRANDVLVLPSLTEGLGLVLLEAMSNGVAVVASDVGGIPEVVINGVNGLLVQPRDPVALAGALDTLANDEGLRQALIAGGLKTARENCLESQLTKWTTPLESLVRERFGPGDPFGAASARDSHG